MIQLVEIELKGNPGSERGIMSMIIKKALEDNEYIVRSGHTEYGLEVEVDTSYKIIEKPQLKQE
jgi:hypothetical protein